MRKIVFAVLVALQFGCVQDEKATFSEEELKLAIEEAARTVVCSSETELAVLEIDLQQCLESIPYVAPACWLGIDKLVASYQIPASEDGKEEFFDIAYVFNKCVRSELLEQVGRDHSAPSG